MVDIEQSDHAIERLSGRFIEACRLNEGKILSLQEAEEEKLKLLAKSDRIELELEKFSDERRKLKIITFSKLLQLKVFFIAVEDKQKKTLEVRTLWTEFDIIK